MMGSWENWERNIWVNKTSSNMPWSRLYLDANGNWKTEKPMPLSRAIDSSVWNVKTIAGKIIPDTHKKRM